MSAMPNNSGLSDSKEFQGNLEVLILGIFLLYNSFDMQDVKP